MKRYTPIVLLSVCLLLAMGANDTHAAAIAESESQTRQCTLLAAENSLAHSAPSISHAGISSAKEVIAADFVRNGYKRTLCAALAGSVLAYTAYKIVEAQFKRKGEDVPAGGAQTAIYHAPPTREEFDRLKDGFVQFQKSMAPDWFTWAWVKNWGKHIGAGLVSMAATKGLFDVTDRIITNVFHDGDLHWFIKAHTQTMEVVGELKAYLERLRESSASAEAEQVKKQIIFITQSLVRQITVLIAYFDYKAETSFNAAASHEEAHLAQYLMVTTNEFARSLTKKMLSQVVEHNSLVDLINAYTNDLGHILTSFDRLEKEQAATV